MEKKIYDLIKKRIYDAFCAVYPMNRESLELKAQYLAEKAIKELTGFSVSDIDNVVKLTLGKEDLKVFEEYIKNSFKDENKKIVEKYTSQEDWRVKENANMAFSLQGLNEYITSNATEKYWLEQIYSPAIKEAHISGDFHIHDLGLFAPYCCGWSLEDLLREGFKGVSGKTESAPAKHFRSALGQAVNFLYTLQGEAAGAQAFSNFDTLLAPFIREDSLNFKEVKQAIQEFVFNCNIPTRVGFQTPFINITLDVKIPKSHKNLPVIIGGKSNFSKVYGDYQKEMDMFNLAFAEVMMEGDSAGRQFSFPIPTYNLTDDFDFESEVFDLIAEMTAKYGIPAFANYRNSDIDPNDITSMCCRLRLDRKQLEKRGGGQFGSAPLTGSIGVVTINMARLGYLTNTQNEFFQKLETLMDLAKESLILKRKTLEKNTDYGLYPYSKYYLRNTKLRTGGYWSNHFNTIGLNGMNECLMNFFSEDVTIGTEKGDAFTIKVLNFMNDILSQYQDTDEELLFNLEATPAEGTGYKLALKDKALYPEIITQGVDEPYYTNSTQLPVNFSENVFDSMIKQEPIQKLYTGGTTFHAHLGERIDKDVCKGLIKKISDHYSGPYFTISPVYSVCQDHGYINGEAFKCPICEKSTEVWARVVGFNRPIQQWNNGKKEEFKDRKHFKIKN